MPGKSQVSLKEYKGEIFLAPQIVGVRYGRYLSRAKRVAPIYLISFSGATADALVLGTRFCGFESLLKYCLKRPQTETLNIRCGDFGKD